LMWAAAALVAVLSAPVPGAAPKHAKPKAGLPGVTVTTQAKVQDPDLADLASARRELYQWACAKDAYSTSLPCQNVQYAKELSKVKDAAQKSLMIQKHQIEGSRRGPDEAWSAAKDMYTAFCARRDLPAESKVCTSVTLKKTYTASTRPSHWVLSAAAPAAAPKHAKPKAGLPGVTPQVKMQDPNLEDLASARRELHQWACAKDTFSASIPCQNVKFAKELAKVKDAAQKSLMIQKHQAESTTGSPEAKAARLDKAWRTTKNMYVQFCARSDLPAGSKVCTNATLKNTYMQSKRPSNYGVSPKKTAVAA